MRLTPTRSLQPVAVLDGLTVAIVAVDRALRITCVNAACEHLFATGRRHVIDQPLAEAIPHFAVLETRLYKALEEGAGFIERELQLARGGEAPLTVDCTVTPFIAPGATGTGLLLEVLALDRHLRASRDELLLVQQETSRELIRGLAHEIKNPLGGIRGAAQLLERAYPDSEHREYTRVIIREADRLQKLVDRMLGPNRLPQMTEMNVHEVLEHVRKLVEAEAPSGVRISRDYDPSIPEFCADREQLVQAVLNVARNALQALADGGGTLLLRTRTRRQLTLGGVRHRLVVQVDVEDDGPGVPPALQEKIFYPMVTGRSGGSGLGLPIAQYLVHGHGGVIECRSRPGCTVFSIFLPLTPTS